MDGGVEDAVALAGTLVAGFSLGFPCHRLRPEGRRTPLLPTAPYGGFGMNSSLSCWGSSIEIEATTVARRLAFQGRVFRVHFDRDAPPIRSATTVVDQILPIWGQPNCAP